jgi:hypothetical protein
MSKGAAAAILTQAYFQSIPEAAAHLKKQADAGGLKGTAPEPGASSLLVLTYKQILETMEKLGGQK